MKSLKALFFSLVFLTSFLAIQSCATDTASVEPVKTEAGMTVPGAQLASWPTADPGSPTTETVAPTPPEDTSTKGWLMDNWGKIVLALVGCYEAVARIFPTIRSISILTWIMRILAYVVPDRAKQGGHFVEGNTTINR